MSINTVNSQETNSDATVLISQGVSLYQKGKTEEAIGSFRKALEIEPNNPIPHGYLLQIHTNLGQYDKAEEDYNKSKKLGSDDELVDVLWLMVEALQRQFKGKNLPPINWDPKDSYLVDLVLTSIPTPWLYQLCIANFKDRDSFLGINGENRKYLVSGAGGARWRFKGSYEAPVEYAPGFYIWEGAVIRDINYGVLVENGTRIKQIIITNDGKKSIRTGQVKDWGFSFDKDF